jgi:hypothetical protein
MYAREANLQSLKKFVGKKKRQACVSFKEDLYDDKKDVMACGF